MPDREFKTDLIRAPWESVGPKEAMCWLRESFSGWCDAAWKGYECTDEDDRAAYAYVAYDVKTLVEACIEAIATRRKVAIGFDEGTLDDEATELLARIVHYGHIRATEGDGAYQEGLIEWSRQLVERVKTKPKADDAD